MQEASTIRCLKYGLLNNGPKTFAILAENICDGAVSSSENIESRLSNYLNSFEIFDFNTLWDFNLRAYYN